MDGLLRFEARYDASVPVITMPDGAIVRGAAPAVHDVLTRGTGRAVTLAHEETISHFDEGPLSLLTTTSLAKVADSVGEPVDARRFRANVLLDSIDGTGVPRMDEPEDAWVGHRVAIGPEGAVAVSHPLEGCLMVNLAQDGFPTDPRILRAVGQQTTVVTSGTFPVGVAVVLH